MFNFLTLCLKRVVSEGGRDRERERERGRWRETQKYRQRESLRRERVREIRDEEKGSQRE